MTEWDRDECYGSNDLTLFDIAHTTRDTAISSLKGDIDINKSLEMGHGCPELGYGYQ